MRFFGRPAAEGPAVLDAGQARIEARIEKVRGGWKIGGTLQGRAGRIEVCRFSAPAEFLANNWQSWGPMQKMRKGERFRGLAERMAKQGRCVFSPVPDAALATLVSDHFVAWEGGLAGFLASRVGHPYFAVEGDEVAGYVEYFDTSFEDAVPLEPLIVLTAPSIEQALEEYGIRAALENGVEVSEWNPVGWSSWYQYFTDLTSTDVEKNLRLARSGYPFEVFQIDDGYEADIGDWLSPKPNFPRLPELARSIREAGFRAGIWTAPFSVAATSRLAAAHPEQLVRAEGAPAVCYRGWDRDVFALDATRDDVKAWLHGTFSDLRGMGFDYFKIDFVFSAAMPGARSRGRTPIQAYREGLAVIRDAVGPSSFLLGCGAPLLPSVGLVDGMRVGEDTAPFWDSVKAPLDGVNAFYALRNPILRSFMNKKWWLNDPDCLLLRRREIDLSESEKELYARTAGALDDMLIESDDLELVDEWGRRLLAEAVGRRGGHVRARGLLNDDAYLIDSWGGPAGIFRYAANLSDSAADLGGVTVPPRSGSFIRP